MLQFARDNTFLGLGNIEHHIGFYEGELNVWYGELIKKIKHKLSPFDLLSLCCSQCRNPETHRKWYQSMLEQHSIPELLFGVANIEYNLGNYKEAQEIYIKTLDLMPSVTNIYINIAFTYYRLDNNKDARHYAFQVNKNMKYNLLAEFIFAITEEKKLDQIDCLEEIVLVEEKYARAWSAIGQTYYELNRLEDSAKYLKKCIQISPNFVKPRFILGKLYYTVLNYREAFDQFEKCVRLNPRHKKAYCYLGNILFNAKTFQKAIECYKKDIEYNPNETRSYENIAQAYQELRKFDNCVEILKKGIEKSPQDKSMAIFLADVYKFFGKDSIAIEKYLKCIDLGCAIGEILPNIIEIYRDASMFKEAIAYAEKWKSLDPEHTGPITYLKDLYAKLQNSISSKGWLPQKMLK